MLHRALRGESQNKWIVNWYYNEYLGTNGPLWPGGDPAYTVQDLDNLCEYGFQTGKNKFQRLVGKRLMEHRGYGATRETKSFTVYTNKASRQILAAK